MHLLQVSGTTLAVLYGAYVAFVVARVAGAGHRLFMLLFFCWAASPIAALVGLRYKSIGGAGRIGELGWLLALVAVGVLGIVVYQKTFFGNRPGAQSALVLVFIPLYQCIAVFVVLFLLALVSRRGNRRGT